MDCVELKLTEVEDEPDVNPSIMDEGSLSNPDQGLARVCPQSHQNFNTTYELGQHITKFHETDCDYFQCRDCKLLFIDHPAFDQHRKSVHGKFMLHKCQVCQKEFSQKNYLTRHVDAVHSTIRPFECPDCPETFTSKKGLAIHRNANHHKIRVFPCNFCQKSFGQDSNLQIHIARFHQDEKKFECDLCSAKFNAKYDLTRHKSISHEKNFQCHICLKNFGQRSVLTAHISMIHDGLRPHACQICNKLFGAKSSLNRHLKIHGSQTDSNKSVEDFSTTSSTNEVGLIGNHDDFAQVQMKAEVMEPNCTKKNQQDRIDEKISEQFCNVTKPNLKNKAKAKAKVKNFEMKSDMKITSHYSTNLIDQFKEEEDIGTWLQQDFETNSNPSEVRVEIPRHLTNKYRHANSSKVTIAKKNQKGQNESYQKSSLQKDDKTFESKKATITNQYNDESAHFEAILTSSVRNSSGPSSREPDQTKLKLSEVDSSSLTRNNKKSIKNLTEPNRSELKRPIKEYLLEESKEPPTIMASTSKLQKQSSKIRHSSNEVERVECPQCKKLFSHRGSLNTHILRLHSDQNRPYCCHLCELTFSIQYDLTRHISTAHEKNFQCSKCLKRFGQKSVLQAHLKTVHFRMKDYKCKFCPMQFGIKSSFKRHLSAKHGNETSTDNDGKSTDNNETNSFYDTNSFVGTSTNFTIPNESSEQKEETSISMQIGPSNEISNVDQSKIKYEISEDIKIEPDSETYNEMIEVKEEILDYDI